MTAVDEIRAEQNVLMITLQKCLRELLTVLMRKLAAKINKNPNVLEGPFIDPKSAVNQNIVGL